MPMRGVGDAGLKLQDASWPIIAARVGGVPGVVNLEPRIGRARGWTAPNRVLFGEDIAGSVVGGFEDQLQLPNCKAYNVY
jgi:hypothetical protein